MEYNPLEYARILGEPKNPKKPLGEIVEDVCEIGYADPDEYTYYYDVLNDTDIVYDVTALGNVTSQAVTPDTPTLFNFTDAMTPEYYVKLTELAKAKEKTLARKTDLINHTLNNYELYYLITVINAAIQPGYTEQLRSAASHFSFENLIHMIDTTKDYGGNYSLIMGSQIDLDIALWDWSDNKYASLSAALDRLNITLHRVTGAVTVGSTAQTILASTTAYLLAKNTVVGKPCLFVRKRLNDIDLLGGSILKSGDKPERLIFVSPNPIMASGGSTRYLAAGVTGFEEIVTAVVNPYAIAKFLRT